MTNPIDKYLEGTVARDALTDWQRADADAVEQVIQTTRAFLAARPAPDVTASVMRQIGMRAPVATRPRAGLFSRIVKRFWTPREVVVRPAYALVAVGAWVALLALAPATSRIVAPAQQAAVRPADARLFVQFRLQTDASRVQLAGSFTNWEPRYELHQTLPGVWTVAVPLGQGVHDYAFVVDGHEWIPDPAAPRIDDGFGGSNSRLTLLSAGVQL